MQYAHEQLSKRGQRSHAMREHPEGYANFDDDYDNDNDNEDDNRAQSIP